ncbi:MAG: NPCBM/NEW2 domain-containing protein [Pirellulales bacterium]
MLVGKPETEATISSIDQQEKWTIETADGTQIIPTEEIVRYGQMKSAAKDHIAILDDGSQLVIYDSVIEKRKIKGYSELWDTVEFSLRNTRGLILQIPLQPVDRRRLIDQVSNYQDTNDRVVFVNGDRLSGLISRLSLKDPDDNKETLQIRTTAGTVDVDAARVAAIMFAPSINTTDVNNRLHWIGLQDGSLLRCKSFQWNNQTLSVTLSDGTILKSPPGIKLQREISLIQPSSSKVKFLSDLTPLGYKHIPFLKLKWDYQTDRNVQQGDLTVDGKSYFKGLGTHATSRLAYRVPSNAVRFASSLGIDDITAGQGSVVFRIYTASTDGKWTVAYQSPTVRGGDSLVPVSLELKDVKAIALVVDHADGADILDHANWIEARFETE